MTPVTVRSAPLLLAGVSAALPPRSEPPPARPRVIQDTWRAFIPRMAEIGGRRGGERYAVIENDVLESGAPPTFRAMIAVDSFAGVPAWCERFTVAPGRYAVFAHKGHPKDMGRMVAAIHRDWMGKIDGLFQKELEIMVYPPGYDAMDPEAGFAYWLPLP